MNKQTITLTFKELDIITDALSIMRKEYPLSWSKEDQETLIKMQNAWYEIYRKTKGEKDHGEEESWSEESATTEGTV